MFLAYRRCGSLLVVRMMRQGSNPSLFPIDRDALRYHCVLCTLKNLRVYEGKAFQEYRGKKKKLVDFFKIKEVLKKKRGS